MPVLTCTKDGTPGHKWGEQGVCFIGSDSTDRAAEVGRAISVSENPIKKATDSFKQMLIGTLEQWKHNILHSEPPFEVSGAEPAKISFKTDENEKTTYKAVDTDKRLITGVVLEPEIFDGQGEIYSSDVIEKSAFDFMENGPIIGKQHEEKTDTVVVESFIAREDMLIGEKPVIKGTWIMTVKVLDDELWEEVKLGHFTGFSIGGSAYGENI